MKYEGTDAYRRSWDDWQPDTQGEGQFDLEDLSIVAGTDVAFVHCFIRCGGALPDGKTDEDLVRAPSNPRLRQRSIWQSRSRAT
jgi:ketosteroid isomerase-like protein